MSSESDRLLELLADRALVGLGQREQIELAELLIKAQDVDVGAFDKSATAIALASVGVLEPLPASLAKHLEQTAETLLEGRTRPASDYLKTRELDKLAPGLVQTQVDPIIDPEPAEPEEPSEIVAPSPPADFTRTHEMQDRPAAAEPEPVSIPTLTRPGNAYPAVSTAPSAFTPPPSPVPAAPPSPPPAPPISYARAPLPAPSAMSKNVVRFPTDRSRTPSRAVAIGGWVAAAACLLLAIGAFASRSPAATVVTFPAPLPLPPSAVAPTPNAPARTVTPAELRASLLAAAGTTRAEWTTTKDPLSKPTTGEVLWNKDQQKGAMVFKGLANNDPTRAQYQLWIFDKTRDEKFPVDGGVFDVDSESGDVVVPIRATLPVNAPTLFAVTLEQPGGVVVSKRDRMIVTAKPAG